MHLLRAFARPLVRGVEVVLVAPDRRYHHMPMRSAVLRGALPLADAAIDLERLAERAGARTIWSHPGAIDLQQRTIAVSGERLPFDVCSIDLVCLAHGAELPGVAEHALTLRPMERLPQLREAILARLASGSNSLDCVIVGGGVTGVETAFALSGMLASSGRTGVVTIVEAEQTVLARSAACAPAAVRLLERAGVCFALGARVIEVRGDSVVLASGAVMSADLVLWATGPGAPDFIRASDLPYDDEGRFVVDARLRAADGSPVWGVGDAVVGTGGIARSDRPTAPHALERELRDALGARRARLRRTPRNRCLIDTADGRAITDSLLGRGHSRLAGWLKRRFDRRFVRV